MREINRQKNFGLVRMSPNRFDHLLELIKPMIMEKNSVRAPIPPDERLAIVPRFLANGKSQTSLSYYFKIGKATVCGSGIHAFFYKQHFYKQCQSEIDKKLSKS